MTPSNWGRFGPDDQLGTLNLLTPQAVLRGVASVRTGERYPLNLPLDMPKGAFGRRAFEKQPLRVNEERFGMLVNDDYVTLSLQGSSQWDALIHAGLPREDGAFYNGVGPEAVDASGYAHKLGIDNVARRGIAGRGLLLDFPRLVQDPLTSDFVITPHLIRECLRQEQLAPEPGDIICLRTGWTEAYLAAGEEERGRMMRGGLPSAGISPEVAELAYEQGWAALAADNPAVEALPRTDWAASAHIRLLRNLGLTLGEFFHFRELAEAAAADRRWDFLLVAVPLWVPGGAGSPSNAMAIR